MKILDLLRKLGIYRSGSVTYKGDASKRPMPFVDEGVMNASKDYSTAEDLKPGGIIALILSWVFGISFLLLGLLTVFSYFISGIIAIIIGLIIIPPSSTLIVRKLHFNLSRTKLLLIITIGSVLFFAFAGPNL